MGRHRNKLQKRDSKTVILNINISINVQQAGISRLAQHLKGENKMIDISGLVHERVIDMLEEHDMIENNVKEIIFNKISMEDLNEKVYDEIADQLDIDDEIQEAVANAVREYIERM